MRSQGERYGLQKAVDRPQKEPASLYCVDQSPDPQQFHHASQVVSEHMKTHLGTYPIEGLGQEMRCPHPGLDRPERMLDGLATYAHHLRSVIQPSLHRFQYHLVLPAFDSPLLASGALIMERAYLAT